MEHFWKSLIHDGDTVSVHRPAFYAQRFQNFLNKSVFKKAEAAATVVELMAAAASNKRSGASFRRGGNLRRTLSRDQDQAPVSSGNQQAASATVAAPVIVNTLPSNVQHNSGNEANRKVSKHLTLTNDVRTDKRILTAGISMPS